MSYEKDRKERWAAPEIYAQNGPCPNCEKYAICYEGSVLTCDMCGEVVEKEELDHDPNRSPDDVDGKIYRGGIEAKLRGTKVEWLLQKFAGGILWILEQQEKEPDVDLTPYQKSKKWLSTACFAFAVLSALTIVGIPLAVLFLILATLLTPEPYKEAENKD